jgi:hypothetical protein
MMCVELLNPKGCGSKATRIIDFGRQLMAMNGHLHASTALKPLAVLKTRSGLDF